MARFLIVLAASALAAPGRAQDPAASREASVAASEAADLVVVNGRIATLDAARPEADAFAVRGERFVAVGAARDVLRLKGAGTRVIDAGGRRVIPGLDDSHLHAVRAGRFYNLELRWDGVESLERGLAMIREQAQRTPGGQWVRVIGGWSPYQFAERRFPTVAELNEAAPDVPTLVVFLYSKAWLNKAGVAALGLGPGSAPPEGGRYEFAEGGGAVLHAEPNPTILYGTIARLPGLTRAQQVDSTRRFYRELNRFGVTSATDPGGGGHAYPADYEATKVLAAQGKFPLRLANYLFAQRPGAESEDFARWTVEERLRLNLAAARLNGYFIEGAGENLVWSAGDFENFLAPRPELKESMSAELTKVATLLAERGWPIRIHATYDESISRILDVFEPIFRRTGYRGRWCIDHAETLGARNLARIKALGGGVAIQNRMAFAGELFAERYGKEAASQAPPLRRLIESGVPLGAGTDATRVSSYNPWLALSWMVTGKTVGGLRLAADANLLTREEALRLYTVGSAWFSGGEATKGTIAVGRFADFAILSADYFSVPEDEIRTLRAALTAIGGDVVYAEAPFVAFAPEALPAVDPPWSPVARYGGFQDAKAGGTGEEK
ncbi:MAG TPA: amidohydrolase [Planctomycetota bacterium]|nr:amidohydrolase [Planctomycetota bacterium]